MELLFQTCVSTDATTFKGEDVVVEVGERSCGNFHRKIRRGRQRKTVSKEDRIVPAVMDNI